MTTEEKLGKQKKRLKEAQEQLKEARKRYENMTEEEKLAKKEEWKKRTNKNLIKFFLIIGIIIFAVCYYESSTEEPSNKSTTFNNVKSRTKPEEKGTKMLAYDLAIDKVKERLKAPSTAEFPSIFDRKQYVNKITDSIFKIRSWYSAKNVFGVRLRGSFSCTVIFSKGCKNCRFEDLIVK